MTQPRRLYDVLELFRLWNTDLRQDEIAQRLGISAAQLKSAAYRHGLRPRSGRTVTRQADDPTPAEIEAMCLELQSTWSDEERRRRAVGSGHERWTIPTYGRHL